MRITSKAGRGTKMHIMLDGEYRLTVTRDFWYAAGIPEGEELDEARWEELLRRAARAKALDKGLSLLTYRDHSKQELLRKLRERADGDAASEAVEHIAELGLLDDSRYARQLGQELLCRKGMAPRRIVQELVQRGVDRETAREAVEELEEEQAFDPQEKIAELLERKFVNRIHTEKERKRVVDTFLRLGYAYSDVRAVLAECSPLAELAPQDDEMDYLE